VIDGAERASCVCRGRICCDDVVRVTLVSVCNDVWSVGFLLGSVECVGASRRGRLIAVCLGILEQEATGSD